IMVDQIVCIVIDPFLNPFLATFGSTIFSIFYPQPLAGAIREQLEDLDMRIIIENSLFFMIRHMQLVKHFIQTNVELELMVLPIVYRYGDKNYLKNWYKKPCIQIGTVLDSGDGHNKVYKSLLDEVAWILCELYS
ncbi:hypothetical protein ACJX0J_030741, partial [Zea mays]